MQLGVSLSEHVLVERASVPAPFDAGFAVQIKSISLDHPSRACDAIVSEVERLRDRFGPPATTHRVR